MTPTRQRYIELMELRGYSEYSIKNYVQAVSALARFHKKSPLLMSSDDIREFLLYLKREKRIAPRTFNIYYYGMRLFYKLVKPESAITIPFKRMKVPDSIPVVPSIEEIEMLLKAAPNIRDRALITVLYSSGIRLNECVKLKINDIDSKRMVIRVENGKGKKDRFTLLSSRALALLRKYFKQYRPEYVLFQGRAGKPLHKRSVGRIVTDARKKAAIKKNITPHTLRHAFATHLLEKGVSLQIIQKLLGHSDIKTTLIYLRVSMDMVKEVKSPFEFLDKEKTGEEASHGE